MACLKDELDSNHKWNNNQWTRTKNKVTSAIMNN